MATCKECVHYVICQNEAFKEARFSVKAETVIVTIKDRIACKFFQNKADFVEVKWISVKDRLPEKARDYLCRCVIKDNYDYPFFMVLRYILIDENPHFQHECEDGLRVTHWMPLPELPKGCENNAK